MNIRCFLQTSFKALGRVLVLKHLAEPFKRSNEFCKYSAEKKLSESIEKAWLRVYVTAWPMLSQSATAIWKCLHHY